MKKSTNSFLMGCFSVSILLVGMMLGWALTPKPLELSHETFYEILNESALGLSYTLEVETSILFNFSLNQTFTFGINVVGSTSHNLLLLATHYQVAAGNFEAWHWTLEPDQYFFNHTFYDVRDIIQVEYFLY